ncbi:MAG: secretion protein HlyD family protein, partial [Candidatus Binatus sp.]|nr:secretion protein HlyD family protein [Candidatus Binatus sp.]
MKPDESATSKSGELRADFFRKPNGHLQDGLTALQERPSPEPPSNRDPHDDDTDRNGGDDSAIPPPIPQSRRRSSLLRKLALIPLAAVIAFAAVRAWNYLDTYEATDDAQIDGHIAPISARIGGMIAHIYVQDTDYVKAGQLIAEIDPRDVQAAVDNARANLAQA